MARAPKSRQAILAAAEHTFAEKGLAGARTEQIAAAARVNKAMLHYYFGTKEKLYAAVLDDLLKQFRAQVIEPVEATPDPAAALFEYINDHMDFLAAHPNFPRLVQREMMSGGPNMKNLVRGFQRPLSETLRKVLRAGIRKGEFRRVDVDQTIVSVGGLTAFYFIVAPVIAVIIQGDPLHKKLVAARKRAVFEFIGHGLLRDPKQIQRLTKPLTNPTKRPSGKAGKRARK